MSMDHYITRSKRLQEENATLREKLERCREVVEFTLSELSKPVVSYGGADPRDVPAVKRAARDLLNELEAESE